MTVVEHLTELRKRLVISIVAVVVGATICFIFAPEIIAFLVDLLRGGDQGPARRADLHRAARRVRDPPQDRDLRRHRARDAGVALAAVALHHPRAEPQGEEVRGPVRVAPRSSCSCCGAVVAFLTLSRRSTSCSNIGGSDLEPLLTADKYVSLVALMIVAFGLSFEFPVILVFLLLARVLTTAAAAVVAALRGDRRSSPSPR